MVTKCSNRNYQMITNKSYKDLKEYWDFQRKKEYNREMVFGMADQFEGRVYNDFGMVNLQDMKELLWHRVKAEDYEEPRKGWVPEDPKYRFEWEGPAHMPKMRMFEDERPPKRGRPVKQTYQEEEYSDSEEYYQPQQQYQPPTSMSQFYNFV